MSKHAGPGPVEQVLHSLDDQAVSEAVVPVWGKVTVLGPVLIHEGKVTTLGLILMRFLQNNS